MYIQHKPGEKYTTGGRVTVNNEISEYKRKKFCMMNEAEQARRTANNGTQHKREGWWRMFKRGTWREIKGGGGQVMSLHKVTGEKRDCPAHSRLFARLKNRIYYEEENKVTIQRNHNNRETLELRRWILLFFYFPFPSFLVSLLPFPCSSFVSFNDNVIQRSNKINRNVWSR